MSDLERIYASQPDALVKEFGSLGEWQSFQDNFPVADRSRMRAIVERARRHGVSSVHLGAVSEVSCLEQSPIHWDIVAKGLNNVERSVADLTESTQFARKKDRTKIFAGEALSPLAMSLRSTYPLFIGSQYMPEAETQKRLYPIQHQDLAELTFDNSVFDVVTTIEVLEHVPYLDKSLSELARILAPGGIMLSTVPFYWNSAHTQQKAKLVDGIVQHLVDVPEIHGNPMSEEGALVFNAPGWDILDRAVEAGFSSAKMVFYSSAIGGLIGSDIVGRFVFVAYK